MVFTATLLQMEQEPGKELGNICMETPIGVTATAAVEKSSMEEDCPYRLNVLLIGG